ncbi:hypothetical protein NQZ68_002369 [Dissostichus eleginoides]|nr:hypothetical protein NQZ68_002369 [Dissostichus eleginoides]
MACKLCWTHAEGSERVWSNRADNCGALREDLKESSPTFEVSLSLLVMSRCFIIEPGWWGDRHHQRERKGAAA